MSDHPKDSRYGLQALQTPLPKQQHVAYKAGVAVEEFCSLFSKDRVIWQRRQHALEEHEIWDHQPPHRRGPARVEGFLLCLLQANHGEFLKSHHDEHAQ